VVPVGVSFVESMAVAGPPSSCVMDERVSGCGAEVGLPPPPLPPFLALASNSDRVRRPHRHPHRYLGYPPIVPQAHQQPCVSVSVVESGRKRTRTRRWELTQRLTQKSAKNSLFFKKTYELQPYAFVVALYNQS
jgi:hypothetical protein